jgi:hypothetical protein
MSLELLEGSCWREVAGGRLLEASLLAAQSATAAFGLLRPLERTTVAAAAATVAASSVAATVVVAGEAVGRRAAEIALLARGPGPVFCDIEAQIAATDLASMELLDSLGGMLFSSEPNECEASGASTLAVLGNVNVNDLTDLAEELTKLLVRRGEVEVPYEYLT